MPRRWRPSSPATRSPPSTSFPDFVPVLGYLDDVLIVPLGIRLAIWLIPPAILAQHRRAAARAESRRVGIAAAIAIACVWMAAMGCCAWLAYRQFYR